MNPTTRKLIKTIGLVILLPSLGLCIVPLLANYTGVLANLPAYDINIGGLFVSHFEKHDDQASGRTAPWVWAVAGFGELMLLAIQVLAPVRKSQNLVGGRR